MNNNVYLYKTQDYSEALQAVKQIFNSSENVKTLNKDSKVLLKPNLLAKHSPNAAVTTHPAIVGAVADCLHDLGVTDITLADSSGGVYNPSVMQSICKISGLTDICEEKNIKIYTTCKAKSKNIDGEKMQECNLIEPLHDCDFVINLPKMKTHVMTRMSCAVKNLFGCIPGLEKAELHFRFPQKEDFGNMLVDLCQAVKPQLHIVDAVLAMEGNGPAGGKPRFAGMILGGENPYNIDLTVCQIMGINPETVPYLSAAINRGICDKQIDTALLQGDIECANNIPDWLQPDGKASTNFSDKAPKVLRPVMKTLEKTLGPKPKIDLSKCIGCGKCAEICPAKTIKIIDKKAKINYQNCIKCFCCHEMCPVKAIDVKHSKLFKL